MIQGTGSGAGKSLIAAALCRIFRDEGHKVAPFKAQNMALNSSVTPEGGEIGRAQALQAEAAGIPASVDMNPILLKASGEAGSQVIIHGKAFRHMKASEYYAFRNEAWKAVEASYRRLSSRYDVIVMEGAGSPAEINLMDVDIVNMSAARLARAPVLLVGDIDKGGVFASLYGTVKLLGRDASRIKGYIINKFRGDLKILEPGLGMIKEKTGKPVIGVLPYITDIGLPEEDGLSLGSHARGSGQGRVRVVVVRPKFISNFTDFDPFFYEPDVELVYSKNPGDIENADLLILPGSKNTVKDLLYLRENRLDESIKAAYKKGVELVGMCGGYQMLGRKLFDPDGVESDCRETEGMGLLEIDTVFEGDKTTRQVEAELIGGTGGVMKGYEIHMGRSTGDIGLFRVRRQGQEKPVLDGSRNGNCWGTYIHGIFENDSFRGGLLDRIREKKGLPRMDRPVDYAAAKGAAIGRLADVVRSHVDMPFIREITGLS